MEIRRNRRWVLLFALALLALGLAWPRLVGAEPVPQLTPFDWEIVAVCDDAQDLVKIAVRNGSAASLVPSGELYAQDASESKPRRIATVPQGREIVPGDWSSVEDNLVHHYPDGLFRGVVWGWHEYRDVEGNLVHLATLAPTLVSCGDLVFLPLIGR